MLKASIRGSSFELSILNCYGPYLNRDTFWSAVASAGLLSLPNLILAGDLNLTLNASEIWGSRAQLDPLGSFFNFRSARQLASKVSSLGSQMWDF